jgi:dipeptide/tripeptide permease
MKVIEIGSLCVIILCFFAAECFAFRCGSGLVSSGDTKTRVLVTCGQPTSKVTSCTNSQESTTTNKKGKIKKTKKCGTKADVWHYNCGNEDFIYTLTFENGKLINETTEGRGKGKSDCRGK